MGTVALGFVFGGELMPGIDPYFDDKDRCQSHIRYAREELADIRRATRRIPKLLADIDYWQKRNKEKRWGNGRRWPGAKKLVD